MSIVRKTFTSFVEIPFRLAVSRRRRSVGLTVTDTGDLLVHAPKGLSLDAIRQIVTKNLAWVKRKQAERRQAWARLKPGKVYYRGRALALELTDSGPAGIRLAAGVLVLTDIKPIKDPWPRLLDWYREQAELFLTERVHFFAGHMGLTPPPLEVRDWRRRWGECHPNGLLRFNWRLVLLPPEHLDYIVVHELAHLRVPGHSRRFWQEVGKYLADYADRRSWLKLYGTPFLSWKFEQGETPL